jgi:hypothetical protein
MVQVACSGSPLQRFVMFAKQSGSVRSTADSAATPSQLSAFAAIPHLRRSIRERGRRGRLMRKIPAFLLCLHIPFTHPATIIHEEECVPTSKQFNSSPTPGMMQCMFNR